MNHIFISTTSYHIMICGAAARAIKKTDPKGRYILISTNNSMKSTNFIDPDDWDQVATIKTSDIKPWSLRARKEIKIRVGEIRHTESPQIYLCNDYAWRVQTLASALSKDKNFTILEDGMAAYRQHKTKTRQWLYQNILIRAAHGRGIFNYKGINRSDASRYMAVREGAFPWVSDRSKVRKIDTEFAQEVKRMSTLKKDKVSQAVILTQPLTESLSTNKRKEARIWEEIARFLQKNPTITIKSHPREDESLHAWRVEIIESATGRRSRELDQATPFEAYLPHLKPGAQVASHSSTALYNGAYFRPDVNFYEIKTDPKEGAILLKVETAKQERLPQ